MTLQSLVAHIGHIAPNSFNFNQGVQLAAIQSLSAINHLKCPLCHCILHRPVELPCRSLVCAECIITCLTLSANNTCTCCYDNSPLTASSIMQLLKSSCPNYNLKLLCSSIKNVAQQYPVLLMDAQQVADKFEGAFARLGACHSIYDQCFVTDEKCAELGNSNMMSQWISINYVIFFSYCLLHGLLSPMRISHPKCTYWRITQWSG